MQKFSNLFLDSFGSGCQFKHECSLSRCRKKNTSRLSHPWAMSDKKTLLGIDSQPCFRFFTFWCLGIIKTTVITLTKPWDCFDSLTFRNTQGGCWSSNVAHSKEVTPSLVSSYTVLLFLLLTNFHAILGCTQTFSLKVATIWLMYFLKEALYD
jgi:hypothetical protein